MITKRELARELDVCLRTIDNLVRERRIPVVRIKPRLIRFNFDRVQQALDHLEVREIGRKS